MIQSNNTQIPIKKTTKAVGMISGGMDSTLAAKIVKDLGIDVYGVYFAMPWGCCDKTTAIEASQAIGIKFIVLQLDERYLEIIKNPKHGYGTAMNPCVDCRIHMFSRAAQYMKHIGADFVFTGEVLGQRPMSQKRHSMEQIENGSGLRGRLLRPLCARHLEPTIPEKEGLIDRTKLLSLDGRSRKAQIQLASDLAITAYNQPAGGCLLTDQKFANRMRDTLKHGYRNFRETIALQWGRHFRIHNNFKAILGRDAMENKSLLRYTHPDDRIMQLAVFQGPTLLLKGRNPSREILDIAAGLIQYYSKFRHEPPQEVRFWTVSEPDKIDSITARRISSEQIDAMYI